MIESHHSWGRDLTGMELGGDRLGRLRGGVRRTKFQIQADGDIQKNTESLIG